MIYCIQQEKNTVAVNPKNSWEVGGARQNATVLYPIYYADNDMFQPLWAIFRSQNVHRGKLYRV